MIEYTRLSRAEYNACLENMNANMNLQVFEELNEKLTGKKGAYEDTHPDRVVNPKEETHREFFNDKKAFSIILAARWYRQLEPTLSNSDKLELRKVVKSFSEAHNMINLVWSAQELLQAIRESRY